MKKFTILLSLLSLFCLNALAEKQVPIFKPVSPEIFDFKEVAGPSFMGSEVRKVSSQELDEEQEGQWMKLGLSKGKLIDGWELIYYHYNNGNWVNPNDYPIDVVVERNVNNPNLYRLKYPYQEDSCPFIPDSDYLGQIIFDISDPDNVLVKPGMPAGITANIPSVGISEFSCVNYAGVLEYMGYTKSEAIKKMEELGIPQDTYSEGIVTINEPFIITYPEYNDHLYYNSENKWPSIITLPVKVEPVVVESGIYLGLTSFNDEINSTGISLLNQNTEYSFIDFIDNMKMSNNTLLYYGVEEAISSIKSKSYPKDLKKVLMITFTDGLDQGSLGYRPELITSENYVDYISDMIDKTVIDDLKLEAYSIGIKGLDVTDEDLFMKNMESLATDSKKALTVGDIDDVKTQLTNIYDELIKQTVQRDLDIKVPVLSHGARLRLTLDGTTDPTKVEESETWIEGTFDITNNTLYDVTYNGFSCINGETVKGNKVDNLNILFKFEDCRDLNGNLLDIDKNNIDQWTYVPSRDLWQHNTENDKDGQINIEDIKTSAAIMFVLDCSTSLGSSFTELKDTAKSFIHLLAGNKLDDEDNSDNSDDSSVNQISDENNDIIDWSDAEFFNLQGIKVTNPTNGTFIMVKGNKTKKVIVR